ncbi:MAG: transposase [Saprospiraceae bacterium]
MPKRISADAGYGSEENYDYLQAQGLENYVKYPGFYQEQQHKVKNDPFRTENLFYNAEGDYLVCPMGQHLTYRHTSKVVSKNGYQSNVRVYQAQRCTSCPLCCHKAKPTESFRSTPTFKSIKK